MTYTTMSQPGVRTAWPFRLLVTATVANYLWQVPYMVHQYGWSTRLPSLSAALVLSGAFFAVAAHRYATGRRAGRAMLATFLTVEAIFYLVHNLSGAFLRDLPASNMVVLVASVLGYLNLVLAVAALWWLRQPPTASRQAATSSPYGRPAGDNWKALRPVTSRISNRKGRLIGARVPTRPSSAGGVPDDVRSCCATEATSPSRSATP